MIQKLTDVYNKTEDSNIGKVLKLIGEQLQSSKDTIVKIDEYRNIDSATGQTLDNIGSNVLEYRGQKSEELYRQYIKTKIKANLSGGEMETIIDILNLFFEGSIESVKETYTLSDGAEYDGEPANLLITFYELPETIPYEAIDRVVAGGVGAYYFNQKLKTRYLDLNIEVKNIDQFFNKVGTFNLSEETLK